MTPDIVLMDAVMPGMDGFETCRRLKARPHVAHVPVIFMTGLAETEDVVRGFAAGGVDYVAKPIVPDELIARIRTHLANARLAQSARAALDATGRHLLAVDGNARLLWSTPQAEARLAAAFPTCAGNAAPGQGPAAGLAAGFRLGPEAATWLAVPGAAEAAPLTLAVEAGGAVQLTLIGRLGPDEILLRLTEGRLVRDEDLLREAFGLTARESEVLLWVANGKPNRVIAEILELGARTVDKHVERIFAKLGVENRTAAAAQALKVLGGR
ncbi:response regulator [Tistrella bauzanensis]|uniref:response regulator n=1 Tax=Tistrella bauzanensis TaxID=657419 RepID=UPI001E418AB8